MSPYNSNKLQLTRCFVSFVHFVGRNVCLNVYFVHSSDAGGERRTKDSGLSRDSVTIVRGRLSLTPCARMLQRYRKAHVMKYKEIVSTIKAAPNGAKTFKTRYNELMGTSFHSPSGFISIVRRSAQKAAPSLIGQLDSITGGTANAVAERLDR